MWGNEIDGFICESTFGRSPSKIMSDYFGRPVHLIVKGNTPRPCHPTDTFPELKATTCYQDGYPLLVLSEESIDVLHDEIRARVGTQGIEDKWSKQEFVIERYLFFSFSCNSFFACIKLYSQVVGMQLYHVVFKIAMPYHLTASSPSPQIQAQYRFIWSRAFRGGQF